MTLDLIAPVRKKEMGEKKQLFIMRLFIVAFVAVSAGIAIVQAKSKSLFIAQMMGVSWGALAGAFLAPFLYALYSKKVTKAACWVCFIFSSVLMIANMLVRPMFPVIMQSPINSGAIAMLAGLVIVPVVSAFTRKPDKTLVDEAFACYEEPTSVAQKTALGK
jgi:SSS family solute:Na+ symporter